MTEKQSSESKAPAEGQRTRRAAPLWVQWIANIVLIAIILYLGLGFFQGLASMKTPPPREEPKPSVLRVQTFVATAVDLDRYISSFGTAQPDVQVTVSAEVSGRITQKNQFEIGSEVVGPQIQSLSTGQSSRKPGTLLVQIDPQVYQERVKQVETLLEQNKVSLSRLAREERLNERLLAQQKERLNTITAEYERILDLYNRGVENETRVNQSRLELEQYRETLIRLENQSELLPIQREEIETQRATHESDLKLAELELDKATVRAPIGGSISEVFIEEGQFVRAGDPLVKVTALDKVEVPIAVTIQDANHLRQLLTEKRLLYVELVSRETDFMDEGAIRWMGIIRRIDPVADVETRTVEVFVEVDNRQQRQPLIPGTFVYAKIEAGEITKDQGILVPRDALVDNRLYIAAKNANGSSEFQVAEERQVMIKKTYQLFAVISSGLEHGDEIISTNLDIMTDGSLIEVTQQRHLGSELERLRVPYLKLKE